MRLLVDNIPEEGMDLVFDADPQTVDLGGEEKNVRGAISVRARVDRSGQKIMIASSLSALLSLQCSRCLCELLSPVEAHFRVTYIPTADLLVKEERELKKDELDVYFYKNDVIELDDTIREQIVLSIPMQPLCRPHCLGLCPVCGRDRNQKACSCRDKDADQWRDHGSSQT